MLTVHGRQVSFAQCDLAETEFLRGIISALRRKCPATTASSNFLVLNGYEPDESCRSLGNSSTIAFIFDENRTLYPDVVGGVRAVFQAYVADSELLAPNHHSFPLGPAYGFDPGPLKPITERPINCAFVGNLHRGRADFYRWLSGLPLPFAILARLQRLTRRTFDKRFGPSHIRFTNGFAAGLPRSDYSRLLADSKIVLCPGGIVSVESFRLYEAMLAGCVVITERLPTRAWFAGSPVIEVDRWAEAGPIIERLLANPEEMSTLSERTREWYADKLSPEALAKRICTLLV